MGTYKPWFRFHVAALDNLKVQRLPGELFKSWVNLLCVAAKHDGKIPSLADAAYGLRMKEHSAAAVIAKLALAGFLARVEGGYYEPHNWDQWQYKGDCSTERVRVYRDRKRGLKPAERLDTYAETAPAKRDETVSCNGAKRFHETDQSKAKQTKTDIDDEADARLGKPPLISEQANRLADEVAILAGHDLNFVPPSWCGAAYRAQQWLDQGWRTELILSSVREQIGRRRGSGPINSIQYFEGGIAEHIARQDAPLPEIANLPAKQMSLSNARQNDPKSAIAAVDRVFAKLRESEYEGAGNADQTAPKLLPTGSVR